MVEDSARLSSLTASGLAKHGFETDIVTTVADALAALTATHFSAIILDLGLPDGDGLSIVQFLRDRSSPTPVLILTARQSVGDRIKGLRRGADDYLGKPFAFEELVARLQALLRRPRQLPQRPTDPGGPISRCRKLRDHGGWQSPRDFAARGQGAGNADAPEQPRRSKKSSRGRALRPCRRRQRQCGGKRISHACAKKQLLETRAKLQIYTVRGVGHLIKEAPGE